MEGIESVKPTWKALHAIDPVSLHDATADDLGRGDSHPALGWANGIQESSGSPARAEVSSTIGLV